MSRLQFSTSNFTLKEKPMDLELTLVSSDLDDEETQMMTRSICATINRDTPFDAAITEGKTGAGVKGDPITIGSIVLAVLGTGGGAAALINVFKSYMDRTKELCIKVKRPGGDEIEISSKNIDSTELKFAFDAFLDGTRQ
jgi:hypothetical protein